MRSLVGLIVVTCIAWRFGWHLIRTYQPKLQVGRNIVHFGGQSTWIFGLSLLPLAEVFAIEFTIPIWVALLAVIFLGERMTKGRFIAISGGFLGILVILQPGIEIIPARCLRRFGQRHMLWYGDYLYQETGVNGFTARRVVLYVPHSAANGTNPGIIRVGDTARY